MTVHRHRSSQTEYTFLFRHNIIIIIEYSNSKEIAGNSWKFSTEVYFIKNFIKKCFNFYLANRFSDVCTTMCTTATMVCVLIYLIFYLRFEIWSLFLLDDFNGRMILYYITLQTLFIWVYLQVFFLFIHSFCFLFFFSQVLRYDPQFAHCKQFFSLSLSTGRWEKYCKRSKKPHLWKLNSYRCYGQCWWPIATISSYTVQCYCIWLNRKKNWW